MIESVAVSKVFETVEHKLTAINTTFVVTRDKWNQLQAGLKMQSTGEMLWLTRWRVANLTVHFHYKLDLECEAGSLKAFSTPICTDSRPATHSYNTYTPQTWNVRLDHWRPFIVCKHRFQASLTFVWYVHTTNLNWNVRLRHWRLFEHQYALIQGQPHIR